MQLFKRFFCVALSLLLLFSACTLLLPLAASAQESESTRFAFDKLISVGGREYPTEGLDTLTLTLAGDDAAFTAPDGALDLLGDSGETNTLYIALVNRSNATKLTVSYRYTNGHETAPESAEQMLLPQSDEVQEFYLYTPHISGEITALTLTFTAEAGVEGTVTLSSFCNLSLYTAPNAEEQANVAWSSAFHCEYDRESNSVVISGQLNHTALARYRGEVLALFALDPTEDLSLSKKRPIASLDISSSFRFTVAADSAEVLFSRYVIAAETQKGEREPLSAPLYPSLPVDTARELGGFKGFHTPLVSDILDAGADFEILDVYLDRMHGSSDKGILYIGDEYYYFNEVYVAELDNAVRRLSDAGCSVYLRFLISPQPSERQPYFAFANSSDKVENKGVVIETAEALNAVYALTDFLTLRYTAGDNGKINGIVLGRSVDNAAVYHDTGSNNLSEFSRLYAAYLQLVAGTARRNDRTLDIVVPLSDRAFAGALSDSDLSGNYYPSLLLTSLLRAMQANTESPAAFSVMLESAQTPACLAAANNGFYGVEGIAKAEALLRQLSASYPFLDTAILYSWTPDATLSVSDLLAAYVWQYIKLFYNPAVRGFHTDLSLLGDADASRVTELLSHVIGRIDTPDTESVTLPTLTTLGLTALTDISPDYRAARMIERRIIKQPLTESGYDADVRPTGSYTYWSFDKAANTSGWYIGQGFEELSILSDTTGRALTAYRANGIDGEFSEIVYHFPAAKNLSVAPLSRFRLAVKGDANACYEVQIRFEGASLTTVSSFTVEGNDPVKDLYINLSANATALDAVSAIRVMVRRLDGGEEGFSLCLYNAAFESETMSHAELASYMAQQTDAPEQEVGADTEDNHLVAILISLGVFLVSLLFILVFVLQHRRNAKKQDL